MYEPNPQRIPRLRQILTGEKKKKKKRVDLNPLNQL